MTDEKIVVQRNRKSVIGAVLVFLAAASSLLNFVVFSTSYNDLYRQYDWFTEYSLEPMALAFLIGPVLLIAAGISALAGRRRLMVWLSAAAVLIQIIEYERFAFIDGVNFNIPFFSELEYLEYSQFTVYFRLASDLGFYGSVVALILFLGALKGTSKPAMPRSKLAAILVASVVSFVAVILLSSVGRDLSYGNSFKVYAGLVVLTWAISMWVSLPIAALAVRKGRSWPLFYWLSALVSPVIMLIIAAVISPPADKGGVRESPSLGVPAPTTSATVSVTVQIQELGLLRDQGLLTDEEFDAKKTELLNRI